MLQRQYCGGAQQCHLTALSDHSRGRTNGDLGFPKAHITNDEAIHWSLECQILQYLIDGSRLIWGLLEWKVSAHIGQQLWVAAVNLDRAVPHEWPAARLGDRPAERLFHGPCSVAWPSCCDQSYRAWDFFVAAIAIQSIELGDVEKYLCIVRVAQLNAVENQPCTLYL